MCVSNISIAQICFAIISLQITWLNECAISNMNQWIMIIQGVSAPSEVYTFWYSRRESLGLLKINSLSPFGCFILMTTSSLKQLVVLTCITCLPVAVENGLLCCWVHTVQKYVMLLFCSFFMQLGKYTAYQPMPHFPLKIALDENVSSISEMLLFETWIDNVGSRIGVENQNSFYSFLYLFFSAQK